MNNYPNTLSNKMYNLGVSFNFYLKNILCVLLEGIKKKNDHEEGKCTLIMERGEDKCLFFM